MKHNVGRPLLACTKGGLFCGRSDMHEHEEEEERGRTDEHWVAMMNQENEGGGGGARGAGDDHRKISRQKRVTKRTNYSFHSLLKSDDSGESSYRSSEHESVSH